MPTRTSILVFAFLLAAGVRAADTPQKQPAAVFFSPNGDGILDRAIFHLRVSEPGNITQWDFLIDDTQGNEIKRFGGKGAPPGVLEWDGKDENNELIRDGLYHYTLSIVTLAGTRVSMPPQDVICDRQAPEAQASVEPSVFSPEEGSAKPIAHFFLQAYDANGINSWLLRIRSDAAEKSFFGRGQPPKEEDWDGRTDAGDPAPNGDYTFTFAARDMAGNTTTTSPQTVRIDRTEPVTQVDARPAIFSPNGDGVNDVTSFQIQPPSLKKVIENWTLSIKDLKGRAVKTFEGTGEPPREIDWDGAAADGKPVADGAYNYAFLTVDQAGNRGLTIPKTLIVDTKPPTASVAFQPALISPNGDGFADSGSFQIQAQDENGIAGYTLEIHNDVGDLKRSFKGEGTPPKNVDWAGQDDSGALLPDGKYTYDLAVIDRAGNKTVTAVQTAQIDTNPPVVQFSVDPPLISPNGDQKEALFHISEEDASPIDAWDLKIKDVNGKIVRHFEGKGALNGDLAWDGRSDEKALAPDGEYSCVFWTQDVAHNGVTLSPKTVTVGAAIPRISVSASLPDFSPNADGVMDSVDFALTTRSFNKIRQWSVEINDATGLRVRTFAGEGAPPKAVTWAGERDDKSPSPDGFYTYSFHVVDKAGNKNDTAPQRIQIDTTRPEISVKAAPALFSPNGDGYLDTTAFQIAYRDASPAGRWELAIKSESGKTVKTFHGDGSLPSELPWDGKGDAGKVVADGPYTYTLTAADAVGNKSETLDQILRVDTMPPELTLSVAPAIFAPKSDTGQNQVVFSGTAQDVANASNIVKWSLKISDAKGAVVKQFDGEGHPPAEIVWDGVDAKGQPFADGVYQGRLYATCEAGNEGKSAPASVTINAAKPVLVVETEEESVPSLMPELKTVETSRGLVIPLAAEVLFEVGKAQVKPEAFETLDEAAALIRKYIGRKIVIEGHTDNTPIHDASFADNRALSQARAEAVRDYFVKNKGLDGSRLTARGFGDRRPIADNSTPEGRRKNRRVEIIIEKAPAMSAQKDSGDGEGD